MLNVGHKSLFSEGAIKQTAKPAETIEGFSDALKKAIDNMSAQETEVHKVSDRFIIGEADISEVMIVSQQTLLGLQLTSQIRNKVIESYQEIMRMQM
ncbi:flagellar hook-basal body complex protein FliE [Paenibacillaceae bacterium]|nr:flagellar hook-basal body complex protein FliE [Paenibacillaceae bacterium]